MSGRDSAVQRPFPSAEELLRKRWWMIIAARLVSLLVIPIGLYFLSRWIVEAIADGDLLWWSYYTPTIASGVAFILFGVLMWLFAPLIARVAVTPPRTDRCPACGYHLDLYAYHRCPECGLAALGPRPAQSGAAAIGETDMTPQTPSPEPPATNIPAVVSAKIAEARDLAQRPIWPLSVLANVLFALAILIAFRVIDLSPAACGGVVLAACGATAFASDRKRARNVMRVVRDLEREQETGQATQTEPVPPQNAPPKPD